MELNVLAVGSASMTVRCNTCVREACCTSTTGVCPVTVTASSKLPTFMSALIVTTISAANSRLARTTGENPGKANVRL